MNHRFVRSSEMQGLERVSKTLERVDYVWGFVVCAGLIYNYILFFYFLGIPGAPGGMALICEMFFEFILLLDTCVVTYLYLKDYRILKSMLIDHLASWTSNERVALVIIWISTFPQHIVFFLTAVDAKTLASLSFALLRGLKLLRYPEVWSYFESQLRYVKAANTIYAKILQHMLNIFMLIHAIAMLCLTLVRMERYPEWLEKYGLQQGSMLEIYSQFLLLAVSNMGGMCYGDIPPVSNYEIIIYCLMVFLGATALASLFANLANSIYIRNSHSIEIQQKLIQINSFIATRSVSNRLKRQLRVYYTTIRPDYKPYRCF